MLVGLGVYNWILERIQFLKKKWTYILVAYHCSYLTIMFNDCALDPHLIGLLRKKRSLNSFGQFKFHVHNIYNSFEFSISGHCLISSYEPSIKWWNCELRFGVSFCTFSERRVLRENILQRLPLWMNKIEFVFLWNIDKWKSRLEAWTFFIFLLSNTS